jgi:hypothetical protein
MMKLFSGKKQNFQSWNDPQVLDSQDFLITGCQIKQILLHLKIKEK